MKTILVVEDNSIVREEISDILTMENYHVLESENGIQGFNAALEHIPDLIISDIAMPCADGFEMLQKLQNNHITKYIPLVFLSAKSGIRDIRQGMNHGAYDYLTKPISVNDLILSVNKNIEKAQNMKLEMEQLKLELSQVLSHELLTPINGIMGFSELLKTNLNQISNDKIGDFADMINKSSQRLHNTVENFLMYSQLKLELTVPGYGSFYFSKKRIDLKNCIGNLLELFYQNTNRKNDFELDIEDSKICFNPFLFEKMMQELVGNALKFSRTGQKISIVAKNKETHFWLKIRNEGKGLSQDQIKNITSFKQFDRHEQEQQGVGLGLYLVKLITELNSAELKIESEINHFFSVELLITQ